MRDLYAMGFDPLLKENERTSNGANGASSDVQAELDWLQQCDVLTFAYPLWFGMPPTIITRYIDRVLGAGFRVDDFNRSPGGASRQAACSHHHLRLQAYLAGRAWDVVSLRQSFDEYLKTVFGFVRCDHYHADSIVADLRSSGAERILFEVEEFARRVSASAATSQPA